MPRACRDPSASLDEKSFDDPVFETVEADDDEPAARLQQSFGRRKTARQLAKLIVDVDSQRLKGSRRGVPSVHLAPTEDPRHRLGEFERSSVGRLCAMLDDRP